MRGSQLKGAIGVLDFGGQYSHLICRRVRTLGVYAALLPYNTPLPELEEAGSGGIELFSGGPASVYSPLAPRPDRRVLEGPIPVLGICYGFQLIVDAHGGGVKRAAAREYGKSALRIIEKSPLFSGIGKKSIVCWMSHSDSPTRIPDGMTVLGASDNSDYAAVMSADGRQFGVQFHPEVTHTEHGNRFLSIFCSACAAPVNWSLVDFMEETTTRLESSLHGRVLCRLRWS